MTVFVALPDLIDNSVICATLERTFSTVVVATARERAVSELTALGDTGDVKIESGPGDVRSDCGEV